MFLGQSRYIEQIKRLKHWVYGFTWYNRWTEYTENQRYALFLMVLFNSKSVITFSTKEYSKPIKFLKGKSNCLKGKQSGTRECVVGTL